MSKITDIKIEKMIEIINKIDPQFMMKYYRTNKGNYVGLNIKYYLYLFNFNEGIRKYGIQHINDTKQLPLALKQIYEKIRK